MGQMPSFLLPQIMSIIIYQEKETGIGENPFYYSSNGAIVLKKSSSLSGQ
jgi:hypothetical protein